MEIRPVLPSDLSTCAEVFFAAEDELYDRRGLLHLPRNLEALERLFGHIVATDPQRVWLAEQGGTVTAFAMASQRDRFWFLSFLFVRPERQATGVGRRVLRACLPAGVVPDRPVPGDGPTLGTCIDAVQPISAGLYARCGMVPRVPLFACLGRPRPGALRIVRAPGPAVSRYIYPGSAFNVQETMTDDQDTTELREAPTDRADATRDRDRPRSHPAGPPGPGV